MYAHREVEENEAVRMRCCELGVGWVGGWERVCFWGLGRDVSNLGEEGGDGGMFFEWVGGWMGGWVGG